MRVGIDLNNKKTTKITRSLYTIKFLIYFYLLKTFFKNFNCISDTVNEIQPTVRQTDGQRMPNNGFRFYLIDTEP